MSIYVTYRGIESTVRSMQAVGQISEETGHNVLQYAATAKVNGQPWHFVREWIAKDIEKGTGIVEQIEKDANVNNTSIKRI